MLPFRKLYHCASANESIQAVCLLAIQRPIGDQIHPVIHLGIRGEGDYSKAISELLACGRESEILIHDLSEYEHAHYNKIISGKEILFSRIYKEQESSEFSLDINPEHTEPEDTVWSLIIHAKSFPTIKAMFDHLDLFE